MARVGGFYGFPLCLIGPIQYYASAMERVDLMKMMGNSGARRLRKGDVVVLAGSQPQLGLCYILSGSIRIIHRHGDSSLTVGILGAGQFFGEYSLVLDRPTDFDAIAAEVDTAIMYLSPERFLRESRSNPGIMRELLTTAMSRLGLISQTLVNLAMPVMIQVPTDLAPALAENQARNLAIPGLVNNTRSAYFGRGRAVFRQGQVYDGNLYLLTEGRIVATYETDHGSGEVMYFGPGDMFGFSRAETTPIRPYSVVATVDSRVMTFDQDFLLRLLQLNLDCFWSVFRTAVSQIVLLDYAMHDCARAALQADGLPHVQRLGQSLMFGLDPAVLVN